MDGPTHDQFPVQSRHSARNRRNATSRFCRRAVRGRLARDGYQHPGGKAWRRSAFSSRSAGPTLARLGERHGLVGRRAHGLRRAGNAGGSAGLCGAGLVVRITPVWSEPLVLWQAVVGEASSGKSSALAPMRRLLGVIEAERRVHDDVN